MSDMYVLEKSSRLFLNQGGYINLHTKKEIWMPIFSDWLSAPFSPQSVFLRPFLDLFSFFMCILSETVIPME